MLQARAIVSDDIQRSWQVEGLVAVTVLSLVGALDVAKVGSCTVMGDCDFRDSGDSWGVVRPSGYGGVASIEVGGYDHHLA